jgi:hypothetical protein
VQWFKQLCVKQHATFITITIICKLETFINTPQCNSLEKPPSQGPSKILVNNKKGFISLNKKNELYYPMWFLITCYNNYNIS